MRYSWNRLILGSSAVDVGSNPASMSLIHSRGFSSALSPSKKNGFSSFFLAACDIGAAVLVRGEWRRPDGITETAETTLDYVPANSSGEGALIFSADPAAGDLSVRAAGYADP